MDVSHPPGEGKNHVAQDDQRLKIKKRLWLSLLLTLLLWHSWGMGLTMDLNNETKTTLQKHTLSNVEMEPGNDFHMLSYVT